MPSATLTNPHHAKPVKPKRERNKAANEAEQERLALTRLRLNREERDTLDIAAGQCGCEVGYDPSLILSVYVREEEPGAMRDHGRQPGDFTPAIA